MKKEILQETISNELDHFLPRGRSGSYQNKLRLCYSYFRRIDLADGGPKGPEMILEKCRTQGLAPEAKQKTEEMIEKN